MDSDPS